MGVIYAQAGGGPSFDRDSRKSVPDCKGLDDRQVSFSTVKFLRKTKPKLWYASWKLRIHSGFDYIGDQEGGSCANSLCVVFE